MNRKEALYWCVNNWELWPESSTGVNYPKGFHTAPSSEFSIINEDYMVIAEQDWLDAKAKKEKEMKTIDLENAPDGATHYYVGNDDTRKGYYKRDISCAYKWCNSLWMAYTNDMNWFEDKCKPLSTEQIYNPKIGELCEVNEIVKNQRENFVKVTLKYADKKLYVLEHFASKNTYVKYIGTVEFRPIKTEREKLFDECVKALKNIPQCDEVNAHHKDAIEWLIDKGFIHAPTT